ncbi:MAG TPA: ABC transporter substrate-binding protein [Xanthobacteraceae bacterium]|nr:ABC transporter substrate-binding protein [Xanthobacteraceae bacterium]
MFTRRYGVAAALAAGAIAIASSFPAAAEDGVAADSITFGQAAVLDGPASALGQGMRAGIQAAFDEVNGKGGVYGRKLMLLSRDDGYEPDRAIAQTRKLIEEDKVFALIGAVGTPTSAAAQPIATAAKVPFIGPFTGAAFLRNPKLDNVVNVRASYGAETEAWIKHLTEDLKITKIAIFYQDDAFGRAGLDGVKAAMGKRGMELAGEATFERNTVAVKTALITLKRAEPEAVVMVGTYKPCAEFIRLARKLAFNPVFVNISFVGATALAKELGPDGKGVVVSQVVPFPWDATLKVVADYQAAIKATPDFVSLEGYLVGRLVIAALDKAGAQPTREGLVKAIKDTGKFDLGGLAMTFGPTKNEGLDEVFLTVIQPDGSFKPVEKLTM